MMQLSFDALPSISEFLSLEPWYSMVAIIALEASSTVSPQLFSFHVIFCTNLAVSDVEPLQSFSEPRVASAAQLFAVDGRTRRLAVSM